MGRNKMLLGVALFLLFALGHAQVTPGDEHSRCTNQLDPYPPRTMMLMNSRHYSALLGPDGVWDQMDLDDNDPETSFNPTYFKHNAGGICRWSVMSCGYRSGWQDNYLFTQFISKAAPPDTTHTVRVIVDILYTLSSCRTRYNCNPKFELLKFETDGPQPREVFTNHTNYQSIRVRTGSSAVTQRLVENIDIPANIEGIYLAVRDNRSCIQVAQVQVYRYQCPRKQEGLVVFPDTAAPVNGNMTIMAECMPNSSPVVPNNMAMICDKDGNWRGAGSCRCDPGYKRVRGQNGESCVSCPEGTYRTASAPERVCLRCPANTEKDEVAAPECECQAGYFRNMEGMRDTCPANQRPETVSDNCTQPPSSPRNLVMTGSTAESLNVSWSAPEYNGGRRDLYYRVHYSDPDNVGVLLESECTECHNGTSCTISGLRPATVYVVQVSAHNGVSDQDEGGALARMTDTTLVTDPAPPSAPQRPQAFCQVVVWEEPEHTNGDITKYLVKYFELVHEVPGDRNSFVLPTDLPSGTVIRINAVNVAGTGPFVTTTIPSDCAGPLFSCPPCPGCIDCPTPTPSECPTVPVPTVTRTTTVTVPPVTITRTTTVARIVPTTVTRVSTSTVRTTVTSTTTRTTSTPCPTPPPSSPTTGAAVSRPGPVTDITVMGPCSIAWRPPVNNGGERPGYAIRFFDGATYDESVDFKRILRFFDDPDKMFYTLEDCPTNRVIYADIRARNSEGSADYSSIIQVSDPNTLSTSSCPACDSCCGTCATQEPCPTCAPPTICPTCPPRVTCQACPTTPPPTSCPTATCPTCPVPTECPPRDCSTDSSPETTTEAVTVTLPPCGSTETIPSDVIGIRSVPCGRIEWEPATVAGCSDDGITYRIRVFTGSSFSSTDDDDRDILSSNTNSLSFTLNQLPHGRPLKAMVKARRSNGVFSANWSEAMNIIEESDNC